MAKKGPSKSPSPASSILETELEAKFKAACEKRGWLCFKLDARGNAGMPDRVVAADGGVTVFVELKRDDGVVSALQRFTHRQLASREHAVMTLRGEGEILTVLDTIEKLVDNAT